MWPMFSSAFKQARMTFTSWISSPKQHRTYRLRSKALAQEWTFEKDLLHPLVSGTDVSRYGPLPNRQYILFPYTVQNETGRAD